MARTAGVDPALVSYYFGSKGDLFGAAMNMRIRAAEEIAAVLAGDLRSAGPRLVRLAMTAWDDTRDGAIFRALLRWVATDDGAPEAVQAYATQEIATPVAAALEQAGVPGLSIPSDTIYCSSVSLIPIVFLCLISISILMTTGVGRF